MDTLVTIGSWALTILGALVVLITGMAGALRLIAPKTATTKDDELVTLLDKAVAALKWLDDKLLALLGSVTRADVARKAPQVPPSA